MRRFLDTLYNSAAVLAALFLVALLVTVLMSILSRELQWGLRGLDGYAGYFMAASGFLALAHTFQKNEHIRVTFFLSMAKGRVRSAIEIWAVAASSLLALLLAIFSVRLVMQSIQFNDISTSMDATPLWIPQLSMAVGAVIFFVSVLDRLIQVIRSPAVAQSDGEALRHE